MVGTAAQTTTDEAAVQRSTFQVNLGGIIELLSEHLYSSREVYIRELLQNGVDAIRARQLIDPAHQGRVTLRVVLADDGRPQLVFEDDGIGLTLEETHQFLATIGASSKRDLEGVRRAEFIGQFGIGLLSCFMVCDELLMLTRSAKAPDAPVVSWRGRADGTYTTEAREDMTMPCGTHVYLSCKPGQEALFAPERVLALAARFGGLLPFPVEVVAPDGEVTRVNAQPAPWDVDFESASDRREAGLRFGEAIFGEEFLDCIPLSSEAGQVEGLAFVLAHAPSPAARPQHRVYLKHMFLSDAAENLLPSWAFFVKAVINTQALRPTASRESFYEDDVLERTRAQLGDRLREHLERLRKAEPKRLERLIQLHHDALKNLAIHDDDFLRIFVEMLPFETSAGRMSLGAFRQAIGSRPIRYTRTVDQFRQIAPIAAAQGFGVINGGYVFDADLLERVGMVLRVPVERVDPAQLADRFGEVSLSERQEVAALLRVADEVLRPFRCRPIVRRFAPAELPTLYTASDELDFLRGLEQTRSESSDHWAAMLEGMLDAQPDAPHAQLCFNATNPLIRRLTRVEDETMLRMAIQTMYVQALLMGHHPLNAREMALLNTSLLDWIELGIDHHKEWLQ